MLRVGKWTIRLVFGLFALAVAGVWIGTRTERGQGVVIRYALSRIEGTIQGRISVGGVHSADLMGGATLVDVRIADSAGRAILTVDSIRLDLSLLSVLGPNVEFDAISVWGGVARIERAHGDSITNVQRLLRGPPTTPSPPVGPVPVPPRRRISSQRFNWYGGSVVVALPAIADQLPRDAITESDNDGNVLRLVRIDDLTLRSRELVLSGRAEDEPVVLVDGLSLTLLLGEEPFQLNDLIGPVRWSAGSLTVNASSFTLPRSQGSGEFVYNLDVEGPNGLNLDLELETFDLSDLEPLSGELIDASGSGHFVAEVANGLRAIQFDAAVVQWGGGEVTGNGSIDFAGNDPVFGTTSLTLANIPIDRLAELRDASLPIDGTVSGGLEFEGRLSDMRVEGRLTLESPEAGGPVTASINGRIRLEEPYSARNLELNLDPFRFDLVGAFDPRFQLQGPGRVVITVSAEGKTVDAIVTHLPEEFSASILEVHSTVGPSVDGEDPYLTLTVDARPLASAALRAAYPSFPVKGPWWGRLEGRGFLSAFDFDSEFTTDGGRIELEGRVDLRAPEVGYEFSGSAEDFLVGDAFWDVPDSVVVSGEFAAEGSGLSLDDIRGTLELGLSRGSFGRLAIGASILEVRAEAGQLIVDSIAVRTEVGSFGGSGMLGLADGAMPGIVNLGFESDSLSRFRRIIFGDSLLVQDELDPMEREVLLFQSIDPDTLPTAESYRVEGQVLGDAVLAGSVRDFSVELAAIVVDGAFQSNSAGRADVSVRIDHLPIWPPPFTVTLDADSIDLGGRAMQRGQVTASYDGAAGAFDVSLDRRPGEVYTARGTFAADSAGGVMRLEEVELRAGSARISLLEPASVSWGDRGIEVHDLVLSGGPDNPVRLRAEGAIPIQGEADLRVDFEAVSIGPLWELLLREDTAQGLASGSVTIRGLRSSPEIEGDVAVDDLEFRGLVLDRVSATLDYNERSAFFDFASELEGRTVVSARGMVPMDLSSGVVPERIPEGPIDVTVVVDSMPVSVPMAYFSSFEQPRGTISGEARIRGTPRRLSPEGTFTVANAGFRLEALGVRYRGIGGTFTLFQDGVVAVDIAQTIDGSALVQGEIQLRNPTADPGLFDPGLDLTITVEDFLVVSRRDLTARVDGEVMLTGSYQGPSVTGSVRVTEGVLSAEEIIRASEVVNPSDPAFFDLIVDTTLAGGVRFVDLQPSPFLQKLRASVTIELERGFKLTSREVNVDLEGTLDANWDRVEGDLSLRGTLNTVRGTYTVVGKSFVVESGTVQFVGLPGINPQLQITAVNRVRLSDRAPLNIIATLDGTLQTPRVQLSTDAEGGIGETDLISYLLFGRPSYQLTTGQNAQVAGASGSFFGAAAGAGASIGLATIALSYGALAAQQIGVDNFAVTQQQGAALNSDFLGATVASTLVELGYYLEQDWYVAFLIRPLVSVGAVSQSEFAGATAEWTISDTWTLELFYEDRFTRGRINGFGSGGVQLDKQGGFFLFKTWGY